MDKVITNISEIDAVSLIGGDNTESLDIYDEANISEQGKRDIQYTDLITTYSGYIKQTIQFKNVARWTSFIVFILVFIIIISFAVGAIQLVAHKKNIEIGEMTTIITAATALISSIIVIPQKIVEFIFNREEDKYIVDVIKNTQDFDKS